MSDITSPSRITLVTDDCNGWSAHNRCKALKKFLPEYIVDIIRGGVIGSREAVENATGEGYVHIHYTAGLNYFQSQIRRNPKRFILTLGNERSYYDNYGETRDLIIEFSKKCITTSVSKRLADDLDVPYTPNGVDLELFAAPREVVVGYVGTERANKNYELFLEACEVMDVQPLLLTYPKRIPHEEMPLHHRKMDLLIHPSLTEGCNNVVLEALAMNIPVYMTKRGIWHDLVDYVNFIEPTLEGICRVISRYKGRRLIQEKFSWQKMADNYRAIYDRLA